jgi:hypothetical protein
MFVDKAISLPYSNRLWPYPQALDQAGRASQLIVLSVIVLSVIMLSVVAPLKGPVSNKRSSLFFLHE